MLPNRNRIRMFNEIENVAIDSAPFLLRHPAIDPTQTVHVASGTTMTVTPREMTRADIRQAVADYRNAAQIAKDAGFDGVQLQAGFVYLIQQFLHEATNRRTDEYGGSIENRARFLFDVLEAVLEVWPSERVGVKTGPMMNELGLFKAVESYEKLNAYNLSHIFLMRQLAGLSVMNHRVAGQSTRSSGTDKAARSTERAAPRRLLRRHGVLHGLFVPHRQSSSRGN